MPELDPIEQYLRPEVPPDDAIVVVRGGPADPVFARVRSLTDRPSGTKVHLEILPGDPLDYLEAMRRTHLLTA